mgnify:CR=1 FL=1
MVDTGRARRVEGILWKVDVKGCLKRAQTAIGGFREWLSARRWRSNCVIVERGA